MQNTPQIPIPLRRPGTAAARGSAAAASAQPSDKGTARPPRHRDASSPETLDQFVSVLETEIICQL